MPISANKPLLVDSTQFLCDMSLTVLSNCSSTYNFSSPVFNYESFSSCESMKMLSGVSFHIDLNSFCINSCSLFKTYVVPDKTDMQVTDVSIMPQNVVSPTNSKTFLLNPNFECSNCVLENFRSCKSKCQSLISTLGINITPEMVEASITHGSDFWTHFKIIASPGDGHCIIHSISRCLSHMYAELNVDIYDYLLYMIQLECTVNFTLYTPFMSDYSKHLLYEGIRQYIHGKSYNSGVGDMILNMISNILGLDIVVIDCPGIQYRALTIPPHIHSRCDDYGKTCIIVFKRNLHYDACVPINNSAYNYMLCVSNVPCTSENDSVNNDVCKVSAVACNDMDQSPSLCTDDYSPHASRRVKNSNFSTVPIDLTSLGDSAVPVTYSPSITLSHTNSSCNTSSIESLPCQSNEPVPCPSNKSSGTPSSSTGNLIEISCSSADAPSNQNVNSSIRPCEKSYCTSTLSEFRKKHMKQFIFGHLNVNSFRWKFPEVRDELLTNHILDLAFFSETKLDASFPPAQFSVHGFRDPPFRADRNKNGGGLIAYIRSDIPNRRRYDIEKYMVEYGKIESIALEVTIRTEKWLFLCFYKPPKVKGTCLTQSLENVINSFNMEFKSIYFLGDSNIDQNNPPVHFKDFLDVFGLSCIVEGPTCFKGTPSLIDIILTDTPGRISKTLNVNTGISDFHHLTLASTRMHVPRSSLSKFQYRSMKHFNENEFLKDMSFIPFHVTNIFDDPNDSYWLFNELYTDILNKHAPLKTTRRHPKHAPFMHTDLRKARNVKAMLRRKYDKYPSNKNWENYRKQRNYVTKLRKQSIKQYFTAKCDMNKPTQFWKIIKPFMSDKNPSQNGCITLFENGKIVNDTQEVCNMFNSHFASCANSIGCSDPLKDDECINTISETFENHPSIQSIDNRKLDAHFHFTEVDIDHVAELISKTSVKKSTGSDKISPRLVKLSSSHISQPLTNLINMSIRTNIFPDQLKKAEVSPLFKKDDNMNKVNFRPVSILACISKIFENVYSNQMTDFFNAILSVSLSAFRKLYSCETVLVRLIEDWKALLDKHQVVGAMLLDLSKAFDCLPHRLLVAKLSAYGFNEDACKLIHSYLLNRRQRVKIGDSRSEWLDLKKGVPQGSILGPLLFNIFLNDIFYNISGLYNYADDNTISRHGETVAIVKKHLEDATNCALDWFSDNEMQANPSKFQALLLGTNLENSNISFNVAGAEITPSTSVNLLGIEIDHKLNFSSHIANICVKAGRQLSALARLSKMLDINTKLLIFNSFILSHFNYCPLVWHHCSIGNSRKIEKIQERGLRFVYNDAKSSYSQLLSRANKNVLYIHRLKKIAEFVYKCVNKVGPASVHDLYSIKSIPYDLRDSSRTQQPKTSTTTFGLNSLKYSGAALWNDLPIYLKESFDIKVFKRLIKNWNGPSCTCRACTLCKLSEN